MYELIDNAPAQWSSALKAGLADACNAYAAHIGAIGGGRAINLASLRRLPNRVCCRLLALFGHGLMFDLSPLWEQQGTYHLPLSIWRGSAPRIVTRTTP
jgi:hypothetical protein